MICLFTVIKIEFWSLQIDETLQRSNLIREPIVFFVGT